MISVYAEGGNCSQHMVLWHAPMTISGIQHGICWGGGGGGGGGVGALNSL